MQIPVRDTLYGGDLLPLLLADCKTMEYKKEQEAAIVMCIQKWLTCKRFDAEQLSFYMRRVCMRHVRDRFAHDP